MDASQRTPPAKSFQELVLRLMTFWTEQGCLLTQPFDAEKGAGTYNPNTFLRAIGPEPWRAAYVEPSRRPTDGRYGDNPNRLYRHHQFQVLLKPSPPDLQGLYLASLRAIGIHPEEHDIRFVEDNWESPTLGAWGLGWEVWVDGMEATQFTYFQQCGGLECRPVSGELTYGMERLAMYLQNVDDVYELEYAPGVKYGQVFHQDEVEYSRLSFEELDVSLYSELYDRMEKETERLVGAGLVIPAYDHLLHAAHAFNALDARGAISVTERQGYILRIRDLAKMTAEGYLQSREQLGFPLGRVEDLETMPEAEAPAPGRGDAGPLFVELGTEELPAAEVMDAAHTLARNLAQQLRELRLGGGEPKVYATPRRLAVLIPNVAGRQDDRVVEVAGPPVKAAFKDGRPTKAAEGFARGQGVSIDDLVRRQTPKGEYLYAVIQQPGATAAEVLPAAVERALDGITFKRSMRWGAGRATFSRPVVWLVAAHAGEVLPARFAGVQAGSMSRGHRFMAPDAFEIVDDVAAYEARLDARFVIADPDKRRAMIVEGARRLAAEDGGVVVEDDALLDEITQLVEYPVPLLGSFDPSFLEVPKEVLVSEMQAHQRYLPIVDEAGALRPSFVVIANMRVDDPDLSIGGYRRVLSARFADGAFFFAEDQKRPLIDRLEDLSRVRFHRSLGSVRDKVARFARLALELTDGLAGQLDAPGAPTERRADERVDDAIELGMAAPPGEPDFAWSVARACCLAKADLTTQMVFEFPDLQGVMGAEYARRGGEPEPVWRAIKEHYLPRGAEDELPKGAIGAIMGVADRLDLLVGIFGTGKGPSGAADPFGLRRAALGIIRVLRARGWHLPIEDAIRFALDGLGDRRRREPDEVVSEVKDFFRARLKASLVSEGIPTDVAEAAIEAGYDDLVDAADRAAALAELRASPNFEPLAVTFKRVANILKGDAPEGPDRATLQEDVERALYDATMEVGQRVARAAHDRAYHVAFGSIAELRPVVDAFFDGVMVMDEDEQVRNRRLGLLAMAHRTFAPLADFTKLS